MIRETTRTFRLGIKSLLLHKLRSSLTTLGLLFGVGAVIAMLAIGEGASFEALERIKALGSTNLLLRSKKPPQTQDQSGESVWSATAYGLTYKDADRIKATFPSSKDVVQVRESPAELRRGSFWSSTVVVGTEPGFLEVAGMAMDEGRWLTQVDVDTIRPYCVLGAFAARSLFPLEDPIGLSVRADENRYTVIGVLDELGRSSGSVGPPLDECIFIPITTSRVRVGDEITTRTGGSFSRERIELHEIKIKLGSTEDVLPTANVLRTLIEDNHGDQDDVTVTVPLELLKEEERSKAMWNLVLGSIAGISLLVGGIGIMNVMLATVTERTREIGIRRALGAKRKHIIYQFLVETAVLSGLGGVLGIGFGLAIPIAVEAFADQMTIIRPGHVILAFCISAGVGVSFGIYPAWRAANMDPVEALRHE